MKEIEYSINMDKGRKLARVSNEDHQMLMKSWRGWALRKAIRCDKETAGMMPQNEWTEPEAEGLHLQKRAR